MPDSSRQRFLDTCSGVLVQRPFLWESGFWAGAVERWHKEGLPADADPYEFLGLERFAGTSNLWWPIPDFAVTSVRDEGETELIEDESGQLIRRYKHQFHPGNAGENAEEPLRWPVRNKSSWDFVKTRLQPLDRKRTPWAEAFITGAAGEGMSRSGFSASFDPSAGFATSIYIMCPTYWIMRNLLGYEMMAVKLHDDPALMEDMYEYCAWFAEEQLKAVLSLRVPDVVFLNEEAASGTGPFMSPAMYRRLALPRIAGIAGLCWRMGVPHVLVHCSGDIRQLIPLWLEAGIDGLIPLDAVAGMDPVEVRREFGPKLILIGGINRTILETDTDRIETEVMSKAPKLFAGGRYFPSGDAHFGFTERVPLDNMKYYVDALRRAWEVAQ